MVPFNLFESLENLTASQRDRIFRIFEKYPRLRFSTAQLLKEKKDFGKQGIFCSAEKITSQERQVIENILSGRGQNG